MPEFPELIDGWIIGSESFAKRIRQVVSPDSNEPNVLRARAKPSVTLDEVVSVVTRRIPPQVGRSYYQIKSPPRTTARCTLGGSILDGAAT